MERFIPYKSSSNLYKQQGVFCRNSREINNVPKVPEMFIGDSLLELCNSFWRPSPGAKKNVQPYLRGCKWSPDGTCCLCVVNQDGFHIMELPRDLYDGCPTRDRQITILPAVVHVKEAGLIYDFCWYPNMNSHYPETCSWLSTKMNSPIQMWDAYDGSLRCSYRGFNAVDEMEPALSITFINQGQRIVGGYRDCLRTFDVERPGRDFTQHKIKSAASSFATHGSLLAVGSWNSKINLFSILDNGTYKSVGNLHAHKGGITHMKFTPDGKNLVSGARNDNSLCVWDIRYYRRPLNILKRSVTTNQRIYFDISTCGRYLVSGGTDGVIRVWDNKVTKWTEPYNIKIPNQENATFRFQLHNDCCNSISIHPSRPILATGSGQYHFVDPIKELELEVDSSPACEDTAIELQSLSDESSNEDFTNDIEMHKDNEETQDSDSKKTIDTAIPVSTPILNTCNTTPNSEHICEEPPTKIAKLTATNQSPSKETNMGETSIDEESLRSEPKIDEIMKPTSELRTDSQLTLSQSFEPTTTEQHSNNKSEQNTTSQSILQKNIDLRSPTNLTKVDELETALLKNSDLTCTEKAQSCELAPLSESDTFLRTHTLEGENDTSGKLPEKVEKLGKTATTSSTKVPNVYYEEHSNKCILDMDLESDDSNDVNERKMKYSSDTENNLSFWWITKIFDKKLT